MSLRLKNYENVEKRDFKIKINPRINGTHEPIIEHENNKSHKNSELLEDKSRHKLDDSKTVFNPLSSYEDFKNKNNRPSDNMMNSSQNNFNQEAIKKRLFPKSQSYQMKHLSSATNLKL